MEHSAEIQTVLTSIDTHITGEIQISNLAASLNYSSPYFCRLFRQTVGTSPMLYITRRKLQYALSDICRGKKIIDAAMEYGFETHAGFTKAFKKHFGYPPSLYRLHAGTWMPHQKIDATGGILLKPNIITINPIAVVGYPSRHTIPDVKHTQDIPVYWETIQMNYGPVLSKLHHTFTKSKHCEISLCYDIDSISGEFTYLLGVGVEGNDLAKIEPDMVKLDLPGGLYAVFTTPLVDDTKYTETIRETWNILLSKWLPASGYRFDESRADFEYYDERDHAWLHNNLVQMHIYIPIIKK